MTRIHINYGHSRRDATPDARCLYCERHFAVMAYTYFGAPVCGACWDSNWRTTEDGECDPPFNEIRNPYNCQGRDSVLVPGRFVEMVAVVESARVGDLMRFVYRRLNDGQGLADVPFAVAWYALLEEYATRPSDEENAE